MKRAILTLALIGALTLPNYSYAQSLEEQYRTTLLQLIELLQARIAELIALQDDMKKTIKEVKAPVVAPAVGGEQPFPLDIDVVVGDPLPTRDELGRVSFSFSVKTNGDKMRVTLERPGGGLSIDGGLNRETNQTFELRNEYPGVFKWTITAAKDGVEKTENGQFEIK